MLLTPSIYSPYGLPASRDSVTQNAPTPATYTDGVTEAGAAVDVVAGLVDFTGARTDTSAASESQTGLATFIASRADAGSVAETETATADFVATRADSLTAADAETGVAAFVGARSDALAAADNETGSADFVGARSDALTALETETASAAFSGARSDALTAADTQAGPVAFLGASADALTSADAQNGPTTFVGAQAEAGTVAETSAGLADVAVAASEIVAASDSQAGLLVTSVTLAESMSVAASESGSGAFVGLADEALTVGESATVAADFVNAQSDALTVVDVVMEVSSPPLPAIAALAPGQPGAWYDSTAGLSPSAWLDRMENGNDLVADGAPTVVADEVNGRAVARCSGAAGCYSALVSPIAGATPPLASLAVLMRVRDVATLGYPIALSDDADGDGEGDTTYMGVGWFGTLDSELYQRVAGTYSGSDAVPLAENELALVEVYYDAATPDIRTFVNGVAYPNIYDAPVFTLLAFVRVTIGAISLSSAGDIASDVCAAFALPVALSLEDRQVVYDWITDVYGLELPRLIEGTEYDVAVDESLAVAETSDATLIHFTPAVQLGGGSYTNRRRFGRVYEVTQDESLPLEDRVRSTAQTVARMADTLALADEDTATAAFHVAQPERAALRDRSRGQFDARARADDSLVLAVSEAPSLAVAGVIGERVEIADTMVGHVPLFGAPTWSEDEESAILAAAIDLFLEPA